MPTISVIVPVYKVEKYIYRCVDSILGQTYTDFELILVDDGSPDNSGDICDAYAAKDSRVVVIHQKNGGLSAARNAAIDWVFAYSDSQWLTFIDSDDWIHPEYLERLLAAATDHNVAVSIGGFQRTDGPQPEVHSPDLVASRWLPEDFFVQHNINATIACGKLYKKDCFEIIRYPVGKIHEDEFTTYKILFRQHRIAVIPAPLYAYYQNANSIMHTRSYQAYIHEAEALEGQIIFFRRKKLSVPLEMILQRYAQLIQSAFWQTQSDPDVSKSFKDILMKKIRFFYLRYGKKVGLHPLKQRTMFSHAFPRLMRIYDVMEGVTKRLSKKNGG